MMSPGRILLFFSAIVLSLALIINISRPEKGNICSSSTDKSESISTGPYAFADSVVTGEENTPNDTIIKKSIVTDEESDAKTGFSPRRAVADSLKAGRQVRIIFYGDSQIEGDRITSQLRSLMRTYGGGTGPGMFSPLMPVMYTRSFVVRPSSNWARYTLLDYREGVIPDNTLGPMLSICRFTRPGERSEERVNASVRVTAVPGADEKAARYDRLRIFYGNNHDTVRVRITSSGVLIASGILDRGTGPAEFQTKLPSVHDINIDFSAHVSPDIYAVSLESDTGIIIDNVPVRGSAGLEFVMTDEKTFRETVERLAPDIIVLQYGLNIVRNVRSEYHYYEEALVRQIEFLNRISGGVPVILLSLTDMAHYSGDTLASFSNIPAIHDAQKQAAERTGALFWDAWNAMGGEGSIIRWHESVPALASKDLTHFSNAGADTIAEKIFSDLFRPEAVKEQHLYNVTDTMVSQAPAIEDKNALMQESSATGGFLSSLKYDPQRPFIFTTRLFWIFFLFVLAGFALTHKRRAMCHLWLLLSSLWFYYLAGGVFLFLLLFTTAFTWLSGILVHNARGKALKRVWLTLNIIVLLGLLSYFKYAGFITDTINSLAGTSLNGYNFFAGWSDKNLGTAFDINKIILPVGISFFTFQALSYTTDVYRGKLAAVHNIIDFSFYLTFFPQLVAGPIVRASEFIPQMSSEYSITRNEFGHSLFLIIQGIIKKMIISDFLSVNFIDRVFDAPAIYSGFENLMAVYGYGLQIYCDFSGYTDIAIGLALLLGFKLPVNFNSPYKASNITEFWKRWHISLSRWLKDYLYIPLGGSRKGTFRTGINLMVTMLLGGLWHGANVKFILWGGIHGVALVINKLWQRATLTVRTKTHLGHILGVIVTFNFVSFAWIFFRCNTAHDAFILMGQIVHSFDPGSYGVVLKAYMPVITLILSGYLLHYLPVKVKEAYRGFFIRMPLVLKFAAIIVLCFILHHLGEGVAQPFIYFRF